MKSCFVTRICKCAITDNLIIRRVKRISVKKFCKVILCRNILRIIHLHTKFLHVEHVNTKYC